MEREWGTGGGVDAEVHQEFTEDGGGETYSREIRLTYCRGPSCGTINAWCVTVALLPDAVMMNCTLVRAGNWSSTD